MTIAYSQYERPPSAISDRPSGTLASACTFFVEQPVRIVWKEESLRSAAERTRVGLSEESKPLI